MAACWPAQTCVRKGSSLWLPSASSAPPVHPPVHYPGNPASPPRPAWFPPIADARFLPPHRSGRLLRSPMRAGKPNRNLGFETNRPLPPTRGVPDPRPLPPTEQLPGTRIPLGQQDCSFLLASFRVLLPPLVHRPPEPVRLASGFDDVGLIGQPVQHSLAQSRIW